MNNKIIINIKTEIDLKKILDNEKLSEIIELIGIEKILKELPIDNLIDEIKHRGIFNKMSAVQFYQEFKNK
jgi:hypothetical protein